MKGLVAAPFEPGTSDEAPLSPLPAYVYGVASDNVPKRLVVDRYASTLKRLYFLDNQLLGTKSASRR